MTDKKTTFADLGLSAPVLKALDKKGYEHPSPIQEQVIPKLMNGDKDIVGKAQTGTGKTASFGIPLVEKIDPSKRYTQAVILAPTRELAIQVAKEIDSFTNDSLSIQLLYGGQSIRNEIQGLRKGPHIVVGTPGRLKDHLVKKKTLDLSKVDYFVLDEADEMLNIGFEEEINEIFEYTPDGVRTLLFSATMPRGIYNIAKKYMGDFEMVEIESTSTISDRIEQSYYNVSPRNKFDALSRVIDISEDFYGIVFCKTKLDVDDVASRLVSRGFAAEGIHGDIEQKNRQKILERFKSKKISILVATDVAARGLDVDNLTHVINYALPDNPETYTHRIGRTGRAGKTGIAISFAGKSDYRKLMSIERILGAKIKRAQVPKAEDIIKARNKRLVDSLQKHMEDSNQEYSELVDTIMELGEPKEVISALISELYKDLKQADNMSDIGQGSFGNDSGQVRLFIAKGKNDNLTPGSLMQMIERDTGIRLGDVGNIQLLDAFSFMNVDASVAAGVLDYYKDQNPGRPLVVEAKENKSGGGGRSRSRSSGSRGYRGNSRSGNRSRSNSSNRSRR